MTTMLIVEDNKMFRATLREALDYRFPELRIHEAGGLAEALVQLRRSPPDLALLDVHLPDGNGLDLAATICMDWPDTPVAICTSYDLPEYRDAAHRIGVTSFFVKHDLDWVNLHTFIHGSRIHRSAGLRDNRSC